MTKKEKDIRNEWFKFQRENNKNEKIEIRVEDISKIFSKMFR